MTQNNSEHRARVLRDWAYSVTERGLVPPNGSELSTIARSNALPEKQSAAGQAWGATLGWLLEQFAANATDPLGTIPEALTVPLDVAAATGSSPLNALLAWHEEAIRLSLPRIGELKVAHLRQIAASGKLTEAEITAASPPIVGFFAARLAAVLGAYLKREQPGAGQGVHAAAPQAPVSKNATAGSQPKAATGSETTRDDETHSGDGAISAGQFVRHEFGELAANPLPLTIRSQVEGSARLSWPPHPTFAVYRVISSDQIAPYSPDSGHRVASTTAVLAVDERPLRHAVRHFQVWRNEGTDLEDAYGAQAQLHAAGVVVAPASGVDIREDEGRVIGQWEVLEGTQRVQVFRIPLHEMAGSSGDPRYRIRSEELNLAGFVDSGAQRGQSYIYQVFAEAEVDGVLQLSPPFTEEVSVSVIHQPVLDLSFTLLDDSASPLFDLSWSTPSGGKAIIYRTENPPTAGIERQVRSKEALALAGLGPEHQLAHPVVHAGSHDSMTEVPWPHGWVRAYFTVVVMQGDNAYVGNTVRELRVPKVERPKITERVNRQILTFSWPEGADVVQVFMSPQGSDPLIAVQGEAIAEISQHDYQQIGGLSLNSGQLGFAGCDVHIVSSAFDGGQKVSNDPVTITYPWLHKLSYTANVRRSLLGKQSVTVSLRSAVDVPAAPPFALVFNAKRLPLSVTDGVRLSMERDSDDPGVPSRQFFPGALTATQSAGPWRTNQADFDNDLTKPVGFVRLFAVVDPVMLMRVALIDPPVANLRVTRFLKSASGSLGG